MIESQTLENNVIEADDCLAIKRQMKKGKDKELQGTADSKETRQCRESVLGTHKDLLLTDTAPLDCTLQQCASRR